MPELTRRRFDDEHEGWHVYFGDVRVGTIRKLAGVPTHGDQWGWSIGFYPGMLRQWGGSAASFGDARSAFENAWSAVEPTLSVENYEEWRRHRDWTTWKDRMWKEGCPLPTQSKEGTSRCFCGAEITIAGMTAHIAAVHRGKADEEAS